MAWTSFRSAAIVALAILAGGVGAQAQLRGVGGPSVLGGGGGLGGLGGNVETRLPSRDQGGAIPANAGGAINDAAGTRPRDPLNSVTNTLGGAVPGTSGALESGRRGLDTIERNRINRLDRNAASRTGSGPRRSGVPPLGERRFVSGEVVVGLPSNLSAQALNTLAQRHGLTLLESQNVGLTGTTFHRLRITDQRSVADVVREVEGDVGTGLAQPNYRYVLQQDAAVPAAIQQRFAQYALAKLNWPQAHRLATGNNVLVAVIDSGIDTTHPELAGAIAESIDVTGANEPAHNHGTAVAGIIAAHARLNGIAPAAHILAIRAFSSSGASAESTTVSILRSLDWAVYKGARVINMSFAGPPDPEMERSLAAARQKGVILVAAAGNAGAQSPPLYPAADPNVIAVTATDEHDKLFSQSNRGRYVALAAPGVDILAPAPGGRYQVQTGTSFAAAHISGVVALLLERNPRLTPDTVRNILQSTARHIGAKPRNDQFGSGLADAYKAILSLQPALAGASSPALSAR